MPEERKSRRQRREETRELAKEIIRSGKNKPPAAKFDAGWFLALFMALALLLIAPKIGRPITSVVLVAMIGCLVHPIAQLSVVRGAASTATKTAWFASLMLVAIAAVGAFGIYVWPPLRRHQFSEKERYKFEEPLSKQESPRDTIRLLCPQADENACAYAGQFINFFREAGWTVLRNQVERGAFGRPEAGVMLVLPGTGKLDSSNWNSGLWMRMSPSLENVRQAFVNVEVEPSAAAEPTLLEGIMEIYFGPEKENAAERTDLTKYIENIERARKEGSVPKLQ